MPRDLENYRKYQKAYIKEWRKRNPGRYKETLAEYREKNKERNYAYAKKWKKENVEKVNAHQRRWSNKYRKTNPVFRLNVNVSTNICHSLKGKKAGRGWESLVGYSLNDLEKHLEGKFDEKMTWDNYGSHWEVDHIKPKSLFGYKHPEDKEFKECWALDNLQPLEASENRSKGNKFQELRA